MRLTPGYGAAPDFNRLEYSGRTRYAARGPWRRRPRRSVFLQGRQPLPKCASKITFYEGVDHRQSKPFQKAMVQADYVHSPSPATHFRFRVSVQGIPV